MIVCWGPSKVVKFKKIMLVAQAPPMLNTDFGAVVTFQKTIFGRGGHLSPTLEGHVRKQLLEWHFVSNIGGACAHKYSQKPPRPTSFKLILTGVVRVLCVYFYDSTL